MNTSKTLILSLIATVALGATALAFSSKPATQEVVKLERVVITGKRMQAEQVAQLPRVVIEGRRATQVAAVEQCSSTQVC